MTLSSPLVVEASWQNDRDVFQELAESYRRQLQVHCYRMLGSLQEAEDLVQETFLRAWRARHRFEGRTSFRNWLYRIATNACLNAIAASRSRGPRVLPDAVGAPAQGLALGAPTTAVAWIEPYPDAPLSNLADATPGPEARYQLHESVQLAFIAAVQQLPARQRAVLLLRDVLGWSAAETAQLLDTSVASVNSALQRARATLERLHVSDEGDLPWTDDAQRDLVERYVRTWETLDMDGFVALLKEDAVLRMPPWREWFRGRDTIRAFFAWAWQRGAPDGWRVVPTSANGQPAFAHYTRPAADAAFQAHSIQVVTLERGEIAALTAYRDPTLFAAFDLPPVLPVQR
jgi:RNA polymerase sigma-70 factor, ECF subfamily